MGDIFTNSNPLSGYSSANPLINNNAPTSGGGAVGLLSATGSALTAAQQLGAFGSPQTTQNQQSGTYTNTAPAGTGTSNAGSAADVATYTDNISALNGLLAQADTNRQQGTQGIDTSYNTSNARLADNQAGTMRNYDNQQADTTKGYQSNLNTIDNQARNGFQSLQSLLGGNGSASDILAPLAVANQAGSQTNNARDSFAGNLQSLTNARTDAAKQYKNAQDDLLGQKNSKMSALISSIDQQKQNYLSQIGQQQNQLRIAQGGSYQTPTAQNADIASLQQEQNGLMNQYAAPAFTPQNVNVAAPNLNPYIAQAAQIGGGSNQQQGSAPSDPTLALQALLKQQQEKQYNPYGA